VILLGIAWRALLPPPAALLPGIRMAQRPVLRWAVAGLGFRLSIAELWRIGAPALVVVTLSTFATLVFGWWIARRLGVAEKLGILLGVGARSAAHRRWSRPIRWCRARSRTRRSRSA
jgi:uncharacterized membrane protein YadS